MKKELKREDVENLSYKDIAYLILEREKKGINTLDLFTKIVSLLDLPESTVENKIADFYTTMATDKRFIMIDSVWDLRKRHTSDKIIIDETEDEEEELEENKNDIDLVEDEYGDEYTDDSDVDADFDDTDSDDLADLVVLDEDDADEPADDGHDEEGQERARDGGGDHAAHRGVAGEEVRGHQRADEAVAVAGLQQTHDRAEDGGERAVLRHSAADRTGQRGDGLAEDGGGEGPQQTVGDGEGQRGDAHHDALAGREPLTDQDAQREGGVQDGDDVDEGIGDVPSGAGGQEHDAQRQDQRDGAEDGAEQADLLHPGHDAGQHDLDKDADDGADGVNAGNLLRAAVQVGKDVQGILGKRLVGDVRDELIDDQHPTAEAEASDLFLFHVVRFLLFQISAADDPRGMPLHSPPHFELSRRAADCEECIIGVLE